MLAAAMSVSSAYRGWGLHCADHPGTAGRRSETLKSVSIWRSGLELEASVADEG
jgi:hypothetical protein